MLQVPLVFLDFAWTKVVCSGFYRVTYSGIHVLIDQQAEQTKTLWSWYFFGLLPPCNQGANGLKVTMGNNRELDKKLH